MGAGNWKIFKSVTLPLSFAGIVSATLFIAVSVLSDFGNPLIVGGRFNVLAVEIYTQLTGWLNIGTSAAMGLVLLIPSILLFVMQNRFYKKNRQNQQQHQNPETNNRNTTNRLQTKQRQAKNYAQSQHRKLHLFSHQSKIIQI